MAPPRAAVTVETEPGGDSEGVNTPATRGACVTASRPPPRPRPALRAAPRRACAGRQATPSPPHRACAARPGPSQALQSGPCGRWEAAGDGSRLASTGGSPAICRDLGATSSQLEPRVFLDTESVKAREFARSVQGAHGAGGAARSRGGGWGGTTWPSYKEPPGSPSCFVILRPGPALGCCVGKRNTPSGSLRQKSYVTDCWGTPGLNASSEFTRSSPKSSLL